MKTYCFVFETTTDHYKYRKYFKAKKLTREIIESKIDEWSKEYPTFKGTLELLNIICIDNL